MNAVLKIIILCMGISLCSWVFLLLVRKKINERNTLVWLGGAALIFVLSIFPEWLDVVASWAGVHYPPSLLFLCSFIVLLVIALYQSIQISQLYAKIKEVSQFVALQNGRTDMENSEDAQKRIADEG